MGRPLFYGWTIVAALFVVNFATMATGTLNFGLFVLPMSNDLHMSRSFIGWSQTTRLLSSGLSSFFIGRLIDRHGPRILITCASLLTFACMIGIANAQKSWHILLLFSIMGSMGLAAPGSLLTSVPVTKWFIRKRGKALAIATMGLGIGGITFMPVTQLFIDEIGWRGAWIALAIISLGLTVPVAAALLKRQPEDIGLYPDGEPPHFQKSSRIRLTNEEPVWTASQAMRTRTFWNLIIFFGILGFASGSGSVHRLPYWVEKGFDPQLVSLSFSADAAFAALFALGSGFLLDRISVKYAAIASCIGFTFAVGFMLVPSNSFFLFASGILYGTSVGVNMVVMPYIWADFYGRTFLGSIRGIVLPATLISSAIAAPIAGYIYDARDSYVPVWWLAIIIYLVAVLVIAKTEAPHPPIDESADKLQPQ